MKQLTQGSTRRTLDINIVEPSRLFPLLINFLTEPALHNATAGGVAHAHNL